MSIAARRAWCKNEQISYRYVFDGQRSAEPIKSLTIQTSNGLLYLAFMCWRNYAKEFQKSILLFEAAIDLWKRQKFCDKFIERVKTEHVLPPEQISGFGSLDGRATIRKIVIGTYGYPERIWHLPYYGTAETAKPVRSLQKRF